MIRRIPRAGALLAYLLASACTPQAGSAPKAKVPVGAELVSPESMRVDWCAGPDLRICEDFRPVPVEDIVQLEARLPTILRAKGHPREAELVSGYVRTYWAALRHGRLYIVGNLVCRERINADGIVLLIDICPLISLTFLAGHPELVELQIY